MNIHGKNLRLQPVNDSRIANFQAFFAYYLRQHDHPLCRALHYVGTTAATLLLPAALILGNWGLAVLAPVAGYGLAWIGHFAFERNRPATFKYPVWSLMADYYMLALAVTGRLAQRLHQPFPLTTPATPASPPEKSWPSAQIQR